MCIYISNQGLAEGTPLEKAHIFFEPFPRPKERGS